ncbi:hypothetical protein GUY44_22500 [Pimelobacter simplex]|uniref:Uncharacterized protein n=1 Tax=Nocardioides simplex TaxID=2045 RepID=A0A0A1DPP3_NOCSI|nr:hypothetical protein [Pimelobacter simplex]AIY18557.1 hypothetical protein KR76_20590 [Pimelobacter simplex]MCG8153270.1 hypothetical protein [Pimelobacter simplex]GEB14194.1 hypothetical protein NSI01_25090 [Pimelobacter simplex]SFM32587.1 hypothetical protein SAMN05421671_1226 [Pimelobacter simplex]
MTEHPHDPHDLHDLLTRAVPDDAPTFAPQALVAAARRRRARGRAAGAGLAAAVLAVGAVVAITAPGGDDGTPVARDAAPDPYAVPACPATLPELGTEAAVGTYDGLVGVRLCPDPAAPEADGLVELTDLPNRVTALDAFDPARCAAIDVMVTRQSLLFAYDDGTSVVLPASPCTRASIAGRQVDGGELVAAYLAALADQRDDLSAARPYAGAFDCAAVPAPTPARPGHEKITSGAVCRGYGESPAEPLSEEQVRQVAAAWERPGPLVLAKCTPAEPLSLLLGTDHGDVVQVQDGCLALTWNGRTEAESASLPVSMSDLGLTP